MQSFSFFSRVWVVFWRVLLRLLLGKETRNNVLKVHPEINYVIRGWYFFFSSYGVLIATGDSTGLINESYKEDVYELDKIEEDDVVIDVGAHIGVCTLKAAKKARKGLVVAVEPYPPNFKLLRTNLRMNRLENVVPLNIALADYNGEAKLYIALHTYSHTISDNMTKATDAISNKKMKVKVRTLDSLIKELGVKRVNFIKIDAEGAELNILKGADNTLRNNADLRVAVASYHLLGEVEKVSHFLASRGFNVFVVRRGLIHGKKKK